MDLNKKEQAGRPATVREYPLKGKIFCAECGSAMTITTGASHGRKYLYYSCAGKKRRGQCDNTAIRADKLERSVADTVRAILGDPSNVEGLLSVIREERSTLQQGIADRLDPLVKRRAEVGAELERGVAAVLHGLNSPTLSARIEELEEERARLDHDIQQLNAAAHGSELSDDDLRATLARIVNTPEGDAALLSIVARVEVGKEEITVWTLFDADPNGHLNFSHSGGIVINIPGVGSPPPRQKNAAPFRFRGLRKSRENCISAASFFLSNSDPLTLGSESVGNGCSCKVSHTRSNGPCPSIGWGLCFYL